MVRKVGINYLSRNKSENRRRGVLALSPWTIHTTGVRGRTFSTSHENRWRVIPFAALLAYSKLQLTIQSGSDSNFPSSQIQPGFHLLASWWSFCRASPRIDPAPSIPSPPIASMSSVEASRCFSPVSQHGDSVAESLLRRSPRLRIHRDRDPASEDWLG